MRKRRIAWMGVGLLVIAAGAAWWLFNSTVPEPPLRLGAAADAEWLQQSFGAALPPWDQATRRMADDSHEDIFTLQGVSGKVPRAANGGLDWSWRGPNDDPEFAWFLNRLEDVPALFVAWRETGDTRYRAALNARLQDWVRHNPRPRFYSFSASWRALEAARRVQNVWLPLLFNERSQDALDENTRSLMISSLRDQALSLREQHAFSGNHLITEMTALASIALAFPTCPASTGWLDYALGKIREELHRQFYPDGAQTELANLYQRVVLIELQRLADMLIASRREGEFAKLRPGIEQAWDFYAKTLDPLGHGPLNNDSSLEDDAALVRKAAEIYQRPDWLYIATNGREGVAPKDPPSQYFPYAGLAVMRSGWERDAQWAFFDLGPYGTDHQHADRLHLSLGGGGREFLVDDGRYNYQPGPWRDYFTGPRGHNVILLDGEGTLRPPRKVVAPANVRSEIESANPPREATGYDRFEAVASFAGDFLYGQGPVYHGRSTEYFSGKYWIVTDAILATSPHKIETLWHFHPDCTVKYDGKVIYTDDPGQANLALWPFIGPSDGWNVELIRGRESPTPQGWYSPEFNKRVPATCVSFTAKLNRPELIRWVIWIAPPGQDPRSAFPRIEK